MVSEPTIAMDRHQIIVYGRRTQGDDPHDVHCNVSRRQGSPRLHYGKSHLGTPMTILAIENLIFLKRERRRNARDG